MSHRIEKIAAMIKQEISLVFLYKLNDPTLSLLTVTSVKVSPDLKVAKVYLSVYSKEKRQEVLHKIESIKGYIRSELASKVKMRSIPDLSFFIDDTLDYVEKIEGLIKQIHKDDN